MLGIDLFWFVWCRDLGVFLCVFWFVCLCLFIFFV